MDLLRRLSVPCLVGLIPLEVSAQGLTGALVGTVKDANGGVIPNAPVRVTSPALIGGERQITSSERGQWRGQWRGQFLPPGLYAVSFSSRST